MTRPSRDRPPGDEAGHLPSDEVLPTPYVAEERALRPELERLNGTCTIGVPSVIAVPRTGGGWLYLAGRAPLFTNFVERAYVLGEEDARRLVGRFPTVLKGAVVVIRSRRTAHRAAIDDQTGGGRSAGPS